MLWKTKILKIKGLITTPHLCTVETILVISILMTVRIEIHTVRQDQEVSSPSTDRAMHWDDFYILFLKTKGLTVFVSLFNICVISEQGKMVNKKKVRVYN